MKKRWIRIEHYHAECYRLAGEPYGPAEIGVELRRAPQRMRLQPNLLLQVGPKTHVCRDPAADLGRLKRNRVPLGVPVGAQSYSAGSELLYS